MRAELKERYEEGAWGSATNTILVMMVEGKREKAKEQARLAIENWKEEGKMEVIGRFKDWLKIQGLDLEV